MPRDNLFPSHSLLEFSSYSSDFLSFFFSCNVHLFPRQMFISKEILASIIASGNLSTPSLHGPCHLRLVIMSLSHSYTHTHSIFIIPFIYLWWNPPSRIICSRRSTYRCRLGVVRPYPVFNITGKQNAFARNECKYTLINWFCFGPLGSAAVSIEMS